MFLVEFDIGYYLEPLEEHIFHRFQLKDEGNIFNDDSWVIKSCEVLSKVHLIFQRVNNRKEYLESDSD